MADDGDSGSKAQPKQGSLDGGIATTAQRDEHVVGATSSSNSRGRKNTTGRHHAAAGDGDESWHLTEEGRKEAVTGTSTTTPPAEQRHPGVSGTDGIDNNSNTSNSPSHGKAGVATNATLDSTAAGIAAGSQQGEENEAGASYEEKHVHSVYDSIAPHFSATRYKPWPVIANFLQSLAPGSVGLDVGCGNGKYLGVNPNICIMASDRSAALVRIARDHGGERRSEVAVADGLALPYQKGRVDFAICVAVIHHLSTQERRREAVRALLDCVKPRGEGKVLVYVWALEQSGSRRGWDEGAAQDQLVPWVMKSKGASDTAYQRYYHLFKKGELEEDVESVGGRVLENGYDKDNWWVVASRGI